jgi:hypothetical protein
MLRLKERDTGVRTTALEQVLCCPAAFLVSKMSRVCFRPAFDGTEEVWFDGCAKERNNRSADPP